MCCWPGSDTDLSRHQSWYSGCSQWRPQSRLTSVYQALAFRGRLWKTAARQPCSQLHRPAEPHREDPATKSVLKRQLHSRGESTSRLEKGISKYQSCRFCQVAGSSVKGTASCGGHRRRAHQCTVPNHNVLLSRELEEVIDRAPARKRACLWFQRACSLLRAQRGPTWHAHSFPPFYLRNPGTLNIPLPQPCECAHNSRHMNEPVCVPN